jgi:hypothetical protein
MKITFYIRLILTVIILFFVWKNAHWSVALAITFLSVNAEFSYK